MAGGTSRKNHSEIGSSYIHFNFTPHQDKATASLIGDVPRGVMLDQPPIFLGGQGGLVGPVRIAYGTVIPAGTICRAGHPGGRTAAVRPGTAAFREPQHYRAGPVPRDRAHRAQQPDLHRQHLGAGAVVPAGSQARSWTATRFRAAACRRGARRAWTRSVQERVKRLKELAGKMPASLELASAPRTGVDVRAEP